MLAAGAWAEVPDVVKRALIGATLASISDEVNHAAAAGGFDRDNMHFTTSRLVVDERGWQELSQLLAAAADRVDEIVRESSKRLDGNGATRIPATLVEMLFERPAAQPERDAPD